MVGSDEPIGVGRPLAPPQEPAIGWGSDAIAEILRRLDLPFISLNPGASYRGLHDSLVNYTGNRAPEIVLCLHEEHAVALTHGFAKVTSLRGIGPIAGNAELGGALAAGVAAVREGEAVLVDVRVTPNPKEDG